MNANIPNKIQNIFSIEYEQDIESVKASVEIGDKLYDLYFQDSDCENLQDEYGNYYREQTTSFNFNLAQGCGFTDNERLADDIDEGVYDLEGMDHLVELVNAKVAAYYFVEPSKIIVTGSAASDYKVAVFVEGVQDAEYGFNHSDYIDSIESEGFESLGTWISRLLAERIKNFDDFEFVMKVN